MNKNADVIIIGGGAIGLCCAYYLVKKGIRPLILEKNDFDSGCSFGNSGLIVPSHYTPLASPGIISKGLKWMFNPQSPFYIKPRFSFDLLSWLLKFRSFCNEEHVRKSIRIISQLNLESLSLYNELSEEPGMDFEFQKNGLLVLHKTEKAHSEDINTAGLASGLGIEARILNVAEVQELEPNVRLDIKGGVYYPQDSHITPELFMQNIKAFLEKNGVAIHTGTEALRLETSNEIISRVVTSKGSFKADEVILAGGSWSPGIIKDLHLKLPVQAGKGYSVSLDNQTQRPSIPFILMEARAAVTPMADSIRFAGTLELSGTDLSVNKNRIKGLLNSISQYMPGFVSPDLDKLEIWSGLRPCTPDGLPLLGRFGKYKNLISATGHAMMGMSLAPVTGKLVSEIIQNKNPSIDIKLLNPDRFN